MLEYREKTVQQVSACTCDRCGRHMAPNDDQWEWYEKLSLDWCGGYGSIFGDGACLALDLCQHCVRETLGPWLRVDVPTVPERSIQALKGIVAKPDALVSVDQMGPGASHVHGSVGGFPGEGKDIADAPDRGETLSELHSVAYGDHGRQVAGLANAEPKGSDGPPNHWNYRVMEFRENDEVWREIREVYYRNDNPVGFLSVGASSYWHLSDGDTAPQRILDRMRDALAKPVLRPGDFPRATKA